MLGRRRGQCSWTAVLGEQYYWYCEILDGHMMISPHAGRRIITGHLGPAAINIYQPLAELAVKSRHLVNTFQLVCW